jgi:transposase
LPHPPDSFAVESLIDTLKRYQQLNDLRAKMEGRAEQIFGGNASFEHMKTFPGVGSIIALTIMAEPISLYTSHASSIRRA